MLRGYSEGSKNLTIRFRDPKYPSTGRFNLVGWLEGALQAKGEEEMWIYHPDSLPGTQALNLGL
jgi:hypothetical protein